MVWACSEAGVFSKNATSGHLPARQGQHGVAPLMGTWSQATLTEGVGGPGAGRLPCQPGFTSHSDMLLALSQPSVLSGAHTKSPPHSQPPK